MARVPTQLAYHLLAAGVWFLLGCWYIQFTSPSVNQHSHGIKHTREDILISYAYFEKDDVQRADFEYFLLEGTRQPEQHQRVHISFVISTEQCTPCSAKLQHLIGALVDGPTGMGVAKVAESPDHTLLFRTENVGMDIGSHNVTLQYFMSKSRLWLYKYFFFINSSTKGPFYPSYMPPAWHWTHAFISRMGRQSDWATTGNEVHVVASSLVCLPESDGGGPGPRVESWAYAVDDVGLKVLLAAGVYNVRLCKLCSNDDGIVVGGEYGIGRAMLREGYNMATLMSRYRVGVDWRQSQHWKCNNNVHPSRHGTYAGIAHHPYETVFVKSSWGVAAPYTKRYAAWAQEHAAGGAGTEGEFDKELYQFAISEQAQNPGDVLEKAYNVTAR